MNGWRSWQYARKLDPTCSRLMGSHTFVNAMSNLIVEAIKHVARRYLAEQVAENLAHHFKASARIETL